MARVRVILRRTDAPREKQTQTTLVAGNVVVDQARREASIDGEAVALATRDFELLAYLADNRGISLNRRQLIDGVWGVDWVGDDRTVDVHVRQLRRKLGDALPLSTVWGIGYRLD